MADGKKKYTKIGVLKTGKFGNFIQLGQKGKNKAYDYTVDIRITKSDGTVEMLKDVTSVNLFDPRKRPQREDGKEVNTPDWLLSELTVASEE